MKGALHTQGATAFTSTALPNTGYSTRSPFVIDQETYVVAAVGGTADSCDPSDDGWFTSDFYAFNYLFKGLGRKQAWIAATNPQTLIQRYGEFLHGNPRAERKVVLSKELLESGKLSPVDVVRGSSIVDRFLDKVCEFGELARKEDAKLLLLILCHGAETGELELGGRVGTSGKLTLAKLKGRIDMTVRTTLITTACYSGTWLVDPLFNYAAMTAANDQTQSLSWQRTRSMSRACGSVFASALIKSLSDCSADQQPAEAKEKEKGTAAKEQLWGNASAPGPESATEAQIATYLEFCRAINSLCGSLVENEHEFMFAAENDAWDMAWTDRTGISYLYFEQKWQALKTHVPVDNGQDRDSLAADTDDKTALKPRVGSSSASLSPGLSDRIVVSPHKPLDDLQKAHLRGCITRFLATNPGSWRFSAQQSLGAFLRDCHRRGSPYEHFSEQVIQDGDAPLADYQYNAFSVMQYRTDFAKTLDYIVGVMGLPRPNGQLALLFDHDQWMRKHPIGATEDEEENQRLRREWRDFPARSRFISGQFLGRRTPSQGPQFHAMAEYMIAVMYEYHKSTGSSLENTTRKMDEFFGHLDAMERCLLDLAQADKTVHKTRKRWMESIGKA